jgi:hypothetical protein
LRIESSPPSLTDPDSRSMATVVIFDRSERSCLAVHVRFVLEAEPRLGAAGRGRVEVGRTPIHAPKLGSFDMRYELTDQE